MRKPVPEDFGMKTQEYKQLLEEQARIRNDHFDPPNSFDINILYKALIDAFIMGVAMGVSGGFVGAIAGSIIREFLKKSPTGDNLIKEFALGGVVIGASLTFVSIFKFTYKEQIIQKQLSDPKYDRIKLYNEAMRRYELCREEYWKSLRGLEFEEALANLYRSLGYSVQETRATGDEGIDLILQNDGKKIIVQCKGYEKPIGVGAIRDLYGVLIHTKADSAILACPAGFTYGVIKFAHGKPIELIELEDIIDMAESVNNDKKKE